MKYYKENLAFLVLVALLTFCSQQHLLFLQYLEGNNSSLSLGAICAKVAIYNVSIKRFFEILRRNGHRIAPLDFGLAAHRIGGTQHLDGRRLHERLLYFDIVKRKTHIHVR